MYVYSPWKCTYMYMYPLPLHPTIYNGHSALGCAWQKGTNKSYEKKNKWTFFFYQVSYKTTLRVIHLWSGLVALKGLLQCVVKCAKSTLTSWKEQTVSHDIVFAPCYLLNTFVLTWPCGTSSFLSYLSTMKPQLNYLNKEAAWTFNIIPCLIMTKPLSNFPDISFVICTRM
jgi:hypothetical protein